MISSAVEGVSLSQVKAWLQTAGATRSQLPGKSPYKQKSALKEEAILLQIHNNRGIPKN
jgi:hypothetical protein